MNFPSFQIPQNYLLDFFWTLFTLYILSQSLVSQVYSLGYGRVFTFIVIPWVTTGPETISAILMLLKGYPVACLFNCVYSAVFDLFLVTPLIALSIIVKHRVPIQLDSKPWITLLIVAFIFAIFGLDLKISTIVEGSILTALVSVTVLPLIWYGLNEHFRRSEEVRTPSQTIVYIVTLFVTLYAFGVTAYRFGELASNLANFIPQEWAGLWVAYLTSLPDALYAWFVSVEEIEDAIGELWSCVIHDYTEGIGLPVIASKLAGVTYVLVFSLSQYAVAIAVPVLAFAVLLMNRFKLDSRYVMASIPLFIALTIYSLFIT